jgi:hypothetical protein
MSSEAVISMLFVNAVVIGGFVFFLLKAFHHEKNKRREK